MKHVKHLFTILLLLCATVASAHDFWVGGIYYNITDAVNKTVAVTFEGSSYSFYNEYTGAVTIPASVTYNGTTYRVTSIGFYAFRDCTGLTSIEIPNSVTSIGSYAFRDCTGLTSIEIPNSVTSIGSYAFEGCSGLTSIEIPNSVTNIGNWAFYSCSGLRSVVIGNSVTSIGDSAFSGCSGLTSVVIPNSVTSIGYDAFRNCTGLKTIINYSNLTLTKGSTENGYIAYYADKVINAPNGSIEGDFIWGVVNGVNALCGYIGNCGNLTLPADYKGESYIIGDEAFRDCTGLTSVVIGNSVTSIGSYAFRDCTGLTSIEIPNGVTSIGSYAFYYCTGLTSIVVKEGNTVYDSRNNCNAVIETATNTLVIGCKNTIIPDGVTSIGRGAFSGCTGLTSIVIPNSVTSIGSSAFYECTGLTSVEIPNSVISIGNYAFEGCTGLTSIEIPNSVTSIGYRAFYGCKGLTSIEIPNSVTSIGSSAFEGCTGLKTIINCSNLTLTKGSTGNGYIAYYADKVINAPNGSIEGDYVFGIINGVKSLRQYLGNETSIVLPQNYKGESYIIGGDAFRDCTGLTSVVIGNSVTSIGSDAFYGCSGLTSVVIGNSVTSIGSSAFKGCSNLKTITNYSNIPLSKGLTGNGYIAYYADKVINAHNGSIEGDFIWGVVNGVNALCGYIGNCGNLTLPADYKGESYIIGDDAFYGCSGLTSIEIPNSVTSIGSSAFWACDGLTSVEIPNSVTSIGWGAFCYCTGLTSIEIPNSVTSIGSYAFYGCSGLTSVTSLIPAEYLFAIASNVFYNVDKNSCTLYVPTGAKGTYAATTGWSEFTKIVEFELITETTITINQYGSATYCSPYALDFSEVEGLKAYAATGYKANSQVVTLTRVETAEAGIGLFLKGEPGEYVVPIIESTDEHSLNMLVGTLKQTTVNSTEGAKSNYKFTITAGDEAPMFYPFEDNTTFSAGKAYLQIPTAWLPATAQKAALSIRFDNGLTTDIEDIEEGAWEENTYYDLQGRKVANPSNGIYIINGKKVFVK